MHVTESSLKKNPYAKKNYNRIKIPKQNHHRSLYQEYHILPQKYLESNECNEM
jgi:hypothetical protein